ncbi:MAG: DUF1552 domain-containing protein [Planctomycetes bacterium]|nr:DUF1552 domain-containing protein [Planctomycetota bacterium]
MSRRPWQLDRRTFLRGAGVACAVPYLEAMSPRRGARREAPKRLCFVSFPNGVSLPDDPQYADWRWFPRGEGAEFEFTPVLESLQPFRERLSVLGGLSHPLSRELLGHLAGDTWLTAGDVRGGHYQNRVSVDQLAARELKRHTRYPSLVLSTDGGVGYKSRVSTLSFDLDGRPIPALHRPRDIFERLFAPGAGETTAERRASLARGRKLVDLLLDDSRRLQRRLGAGDQAKLDEFLASLAAVEEQVKRTEAWLDVPMRPFDASHLELDPNPRVDPTAYLRAMYDLIVLAFETDVTRVVTYQTGREDGMGFADNFPNLVLGVKKGHHTITHDNATGHWEEWGRYDQWHAQQFARFVERLSAVRDEHGPLLDRTLVLYGSCCSTTHNARNYPLVLAGGSDLGVAHGRYRIWGDDVPMSNLLLGMLRTVGVAAASFGDSTGTLPGDLLPA